MGTYFSPMSELPCRRPCRIDPNGQTMPSPQGMQSIPPLAMLILPASHLHSSIAMEPRPKVLVPLGHTLQLVRPVLSWYFPCGQRVHDACPKASWYSPRGHGSHAFAAPEGCAEPGRHGLHTSAAHFRTSQWMFLRIPLWNAGQCVHIMCTS